MAIPFKLAACLILPFLFLMAPSGEGNNVAKPLFFRQNMI
jgi:hypothetical protein